MASQLPLPPSGQPARAQFVLSRATPADAAAIAAAEYTCFDDYIREVFMGLKSEADVPLLAARYARTMREDPHDVWIKVVDAESGTLAAASNWKVYPSRMPDDAGDTTPDYLVDEAARARSKLVMDGVNRARRRAMGDVGGFVHLHICFTVAEHRRRGAAALMMRWGCGLADQLSVPGYVEASPDGTALYKSFGFYEIERANAGELDAVNMKRDAVAVAAAARA
ncbi:hypothetical protein GGTG_02523 [Gaeumannomyces tritici R3-111a-1]|uniref:N-acetyltransferase domain-containing protein n=1 Tax=Gaeumannomyces tritici (strain R3-111a-1) TaxID=644352 RepID=J3NML7_GAET3|nr:hypothetical protein GGTG_02523 [Gaeumannomyces tritici R3-111a-1]EJT82550.1 hypothetical protein GGTG_02523 [Gaeumannomyces tritici R3-111a-1]